MAEAAAIIDASPLIFFSRSAHLEILDAFADRYWVPRAVADEILARGPHNITAQALNETKRFTIVDAPVIPLSIAEWRLRRVSQPC